MRVSSSLLSLRFVRPFCAPALCAAVLLASPALAADRTFPVSGFNRVVLAAPYDVRVVTGQPVSVRATGAQSALDRLEVEVKQGELRIALHNRWGISFPRSTVTIEVRVPSLSAASVIGSGTMTIDRVGSAAFSGVVTGSGDLVVRQAEAETVSLTLTGSGDLAIAGSCRTAKVGLRGSGDIKASRLMCRDVTVSLSGSGDVGVGASNSAHLTLAGSGDIEVVGGARCEKTIRGSGDIVCR